MTERAALRGCRLLPARVLAPAPNPPGMPWCPFKDCECYRECPFFVASVERCQFVVKTMQLEDLHKIALIALDRMTEEEARLD